MILRLHLIWKRLLETKVEPKVKRVLDDFMRPRPAIIARKTPRNFMNAMNN